jgi:HSP20 family protein
MLMRFDPFAEFDRLTQRVWNRGWAGTVAGSFMPMDAYRSGDHYVAHLDLPGVDPGSVEVTAENNVLSVTARRSWQPDEGSQVLFAERPRGTFTRRLQLGGGLDVDHIEASFDKGVLTVRIPVAETAKPRKVEITTGSQRKELVGSPS